MRNRYRIFSVGDINAFFGLMLDNMSDLVIMAAILTGVFQLPRELVLYRMIPGSAVGVLVGDLLYTWLAVRLARQTGRGDVTAMPLGLDTPSTFGMAFGVIGPCYLASRDPRLTWQVAMATIVLMGLFKVAASFCGPALRRAVPRAGLLGSIAAVALLLIAYLPLLKLFASPVVGFLSLGVVLVALIARLKLPFRLPGALAGILCGTVAYYILGSVGLLPTGYHQLPPLPDLRPVFPLPTLAAGLCGGVIQSCPYIGHPAYKDMGGRAGYTLATGLFIGLGGMIGYLSFFVDLLPEAAVAPILIFIGIEITAQAFDASPREHFKAIAFAFLPVIACLIQIEFGQLLANLGKSGADLTGDAAALHRATLILGNGFIVTSLLWGGGFAALLDHRLARAALFMLASALATLCGVIHSPLASGAMFLPWAPPVPIVWHLAGGYLVLAVLFLLIGRFAAIRGQGHRWRS